MYQQAWDTWSDSLKFATSMWLFGVSDNYCKELAKWDYTQEYKLSLEKEKSLKNIIEYNQGLITEINNVEIIDSQGNPLGEFDGLDISNKIIYEDKLVTGLNTINPYTGKVSQTPLKWAKKQIYGKTKTRINNLKLATGTKLPGNGAINSYSSIPTIDEIKSCNKFVFRLGGDSPELREAMEEVLLLLHTEFKNYQFEVIYNYPVQQ